MVLVLLVEVTLGVLVAAPAAADPVGVWPMRPDPLVARGFDLPHGPYAAGHRGVDLVGAPGRTVRSAMAGTVSFAGLIAGRGVVVVDHGATRTTYEPLEAAVGVGDRVAAGDPLGRLGVAGSHCLPRACLHWGWIAAGPAAGDGYLDPLRLVGGGPVRLLPLWSRPASGPSRVAPWLPASSGASAFAAGPAR